MQVAVWCQALCTATEFSGTMAIMRRSGSVMFFFRLQGQLVIIDGKMIGAKHRANL